MHIKHFSALSMLAEALPPNLGNTSFSLGRRVFSISLSVVERETLAKRKLAPVGNLLKFFSSGYDSQSDEEEDLGIFSFFGQALALALLNRKEGKRCES